MQLFLIKVHQKGSVDRKFYGFDMSGEALLSRWILSVWKHANLSSTPGTNPSTKETSRKRLS